MLKRATAVCVVHFQVIQSIKGTTITNFNFICWVVFEK